MLRRSFLLSPAVLIAFFIILRTVSQILFKHIAIGPAGHDYLALFFDPLFYLVCVVFIGQVGTWTAVLSRLPLTTAYPFGSLSLITLLASAVILFGEKITSGNIIGTAIIILGAYVIAQKDKRRIYVPKDHP